MVVTDFSLLSQYSAKKSEDAFSALVKRYLDLVYSAALRQVGSRPIAEEIAQSVFVDLARNASQLKPETVLAAWLYQVTRRTCVDMIRRESRRQVRERSAMELSEVNEDSSQWKQIEPLLDEAMQELEDKDRCVILLRFFENKSLREIGETFGISEDGAQKRVSRAVERLREYFSRQGVVASAAAIGVALSANAVHSAPAGLTTAISSSVMISGSSTAATVAATKALTMTTIQKVLVTAAITAAVGTSFYETRAFPGWKRNWARCRNKRLRSTRKSSLCTASGMPPRTDWRPFRPIRSGGAAMPWRYSGCAGKWDGSRERRK